MSNNPFDNFALVNSTNNPGDRISSNPFVIEEPVNEVIPNTSVKSPRDLSMPNETKVQESPSTDQPPSDDVHFTGIHCSSLFPIRF